jgi:hypothetical protein
MKYYSCTITFLLLLSFVSGQESQIELMNKKSKLIDYFNYNYKYLDKNYKISISNREFQNTIVKYEFYPELIKNYSDSLGIVLMAEFNDWDHARFAKMRLTYSWLRLGYHLWLSEHDTKQMAKKYGYTHPYLFKEYLKESGNKNDAYLNSFFNTLRSSLRNTEGVKESDFKNGSINDLMNLALIKSSDRLRDSQTLAYEREHGTKPGNDVKVGVSCGKENCCQDAKTATQ